MLKCICMIERRDLKAGILSCNYVSAAVESLRKSFASLTIDARLVKEFCSFHHQHSHLIKLRSKFLILQLQMTMV